MGDSFEFISDSESDCDDSAYNAENCPTKYITEKCMNNFFKPKQGSAINILHLNCRSLKKNLSELENLLSNLEGRLTAVAVTETWLKSSMKKDFNIAGYNFISMSRSVKRGGGVGLFLNNTFNFHMRIDLCRMLPHLECVFVEIAQENKRNLLLGCVYRPPSTDVSAFNTDFLSILDIISSHKHMNVCIAGDCNLDLLKTSHVEATSEFLNNLMTHSFNPVIRSPTRITSKSATILDNIFINCNTHYDSAIVYSDISDHLPVAVHIELKLDSRKKSNYIQKRFFPQNKIDEFNLTLLDSNWSEVNQLSDSGDPNGAYSKFIELYSSLFELYFPLKQLNMSYKMTPRNEWITCGLMKSCSRKKVLYKRYMKSRTQDSKQKYLNYRNKLKTVLKRAEREYYNNKFTILQGNIRNTWRLVNSIINKGKKCCLVDNFSKDGITISNDTEIVNQFNQYFSSVGKELAAVIPHSKSHFSSFLTGSYLNSFSLHFTNANEILNVVSDFQSKTSAGYDCIPVNIMKTSIACVVKPLVNIINSSFRCGKFPDQLKIAKICPIFKDGKHDLFTNYRPISVLPSFSKIFEKLAYLRLESYLKSKLILNDNQFGFRRNHSSYMAVLDLYDRISEAIDRNEYAIGVFIDLSKAFDTIDHVIMIKKLEHYGIRGLALEWFISYLSNRKQFVQYNGASSSTLDVTCGVPQGSILGPLLFLIYINDITHCSKLLHFILFADDTNLIFSHSILKILIEAVNKELSHLSEWFQANRLSLNVKKTHYIIFGNKRIPLNETYQIIFNNNVIERVASTKFLGITVDENLNWKKHILNVSTKVSRSIGIMNRLRYMLPRSTLLTLYYSMIHPHLLYGLIVWGGANHTALNRLTCLQKKAVRIITNSAYRSPSTPLFKDLKILKLSDMYTLLICLFMFKCLHNLLPFCCLRFSPQLRPILSHRTRANELKYDFFQPRCRTTIRESSLAISGPKFWNSIPSEIKELTSINSFKKCFSQYLVNFY